MALDEQTSRKRPGRKPGQRRRTPTEIARDRREIAKLRLRYRMQPDEIAEQIQAKYYSAPGETVSVSQKQVEAELTALNKRALEDAAGDIKTLRALSIKELEDNERFCLEQFELTQATKTKRGITRKHILTKGKTLEGEEVKKPGTLTEAKIERLHRDGNHAWIELYYKFRNRRYELMGIDPPRKVAPTNPTGDKPFEFSGTEEMRRLIPIFEKLAKAQKE